MRNRASDVGRPRGRKTRCAVYTRKSSDEGLEQDFNSLDAQREACEAFIASHKHEGWTLIATPYDDGGVSGATMQRPAFLRLLDDVRASRVDVVVVYKVDRLTRSLGDFAKIVDTFDAHGVSFVSVTQQFNTTNSMGRLTLNVLLSFAQFEREVTGERIRDKIAASKQKGMWMGGVVPLGYDTDKGKLMVNAKEAETVRHIFRRYAAIGSVRDLKSELDADGIVSKVRRDRTGRTVGGVPLARGVLYTILRNCIYVGEISHGDRRYPGQHEPIVDRPLWDRVQARLSISHIAQVTGRTAREPSLLAGLLFDGSHHRMVAQHTSKKGKRYRYYVSRSPEGQNTNPAFRIAATGIERLITRRIQEFLADDRQLLEAVSPHIATDGELCRYGDRAAALADQWDDLERAQVRTILFVLIVRIDVHEECVDITLDTVGLVDVLTGDPAERVTPKRAVRRENQLTLSVPARIRGAGFGTKLIIDVPPGPGSKGGADPALLRLIAKGHAFRDAMIENGGANLGEVAGNLGVSRSYVTRLVRLTYLAPDITRAILEGRHPPSLTAAKLKQASRLPLIWSEQRALLGFD